MTPPPAPKLTLDDVLTRYMQAPESWRPSLYAYHALGEDPESIHVGTTVGPVPLPTKAAEVNEVQIYQELARRLGEPGRLVVRLMPAVGVAGGHLAAPVSFADETLWRYWGGGRASYAPPPPPAAAPPPAAPLPPPPTDLVGVLMKQITEQTAAQQRQTDMLMAALRENKENQAIVAYQKENERLQRQIEEMTKKTENRSKEEREELVEWGKSMVSADAGSAAAYQMMTGPLEKLSGGIERLIDKSSEVKLVEAQIKLVEAQTKQLEVAAKAAAAGVDVDMQDPPPPPPPNGAKAQA